MNEAPATPGEIELLLTAEQAFPAFERAVLDAKQRIVASFRVFDPSTRLRSEAGLAVGADWFDLLEHVLRCGVMVDIMISDFDPIVSPDMHQMTWSSMRKLLAIAECAGPAARLRAIPAMHPARVGTIPRQLLRSRVRRELREVMENLNALPEVNRRAMFRDMPRLREWMTPDDHGRLRITKRDAPHLYPVSHHQKIAVIDGEVLYVGGLDLNPRRYDTLRHHRPGEETWHDVQLTVRGPVARTAERHLDNLLDVTLDRKPADRETDGFLTTISARRARPLFHISPLRRSEAIARRTKEEVARSRDLIYLETQFFRDRALARVIARAGRDNPSLKLLMVLPAAPEVVAFEGRTKLDARLGEYLQSHCVRRVRSAFGKRCYFASPAQQRDAGPGKEGHRDRHFGAPLIYVHAKLCIFDRRAVIVSSANLNGRSLYWDTEAGLFHEKPAFARDALRRALSHWMPAGNIDADGDVVEQVRAQAELDAVRQPENRDGFLLPYDDEPGSRFGRPLPGIPDEMV